MMKNILLGASLVALLVLAGDVMAKQPSKTPLKIVLSPASTVPSADIVKNLQEKCPNVSITLDSKDSDYMLEARGWPEHYRFTLFRKGGAAAFATSTVLLSNAVKDVCRYVNTNPAPAESAPVKSSSKP